jgi:hypothetical protein
MESTAITTRDLKAGIEDPLWGVNVVFRSRGDAKIRSCFYSLSAAARGGILVPPNKILDQHSRRLTMAAISMSDRRGKWDIARRDAKVRAWPTPAGSPDSTGQPALVNDNYFFPLATIIICQ